MNVGFLNSTELECAVICKPVHQLEAEVLRFHKYSRTPYAEFFNFFCSKVWGGGGKEDFEVFCLY